MRITSTTLLLRLPLNLRTHRPDVAEGENAEQSEIPVTDASGSQNKSPSRLAVGETRITSKLPVVSTRRSTPLLVDSSDPPYNARNSELGSAISSLCLALPFQDDSAVSEDNLSSLNYLYERLGNILLAHDYPTKLREIEISMNAVRQHIQAVMHAHNDLPTRPGQISQYPHAISGRIEDEIYNRSALYEDPTLHDSNLASPDIPLDLSPGSTALSSPSTLQPYVRLRPQRSPNDPPLPISNRDPALPVRCEWGRCTYETPRSMDGSERARLRQHFAADHEECTNTSGRCRWRACTIERVLHYPKAHVESAHLETVRQICQMCGIELPTAKGLQHHYVGKHGGSR